MSADLHRVGVAIVWLALALSPKSLAEEVARPDGKRLFAEAAQPPCAVCHTLRAADATADVGPSLDELAPDAERVAKAVRNGLGVMPSYEGKLSDAEIEALAEYVAKGAAGETGR